MLEVLPSRWLWRTATRGVLLVLVFGAGLLVLRTRTHTQPPLGSPPASLLSLKTATTASPVHANHKAAPDLANVPQQVVRRAAQAPAEAAPSSLSSLSSSLAILELGGAFARLRLQQQPQQQAPPLATGLRHADQPPLPVPHTDEHLGDREQQQGHNGPGGGGAVGTLALVEVAVRGARDKPWHVLDARPALFELGTPRGGRSSLQCLLTRLEAVPNKDVRDKNQHEGNVATQVVAVQSVTAWFDCGGFEVEWSAALPAAGVRYLRWATLLRRTLPAADHPMYATVWFGKESNERVCLSRLSKSLPLSFSLTVVLILGSTVVCYAMHVHAQGMRKCPQAKGRN